MNPDLFPETLLVTIASENISTTSLKVAEHFQKRHANVLRAIENSECSERFRQLNFESATYLDQQKKPRQMYRISKDGFWMLAMGFTGAEAARWREAFIDAFNHMEAELHRLQGAKASALDMLRPNLQAIIDGERIGANRALVARYLGKSMGAVSYHRCVARRLGLIGQRQGGAA